ncbi:hypothetical protein CDSM653_02588 [Caldanaerobacter subterraneus subsp. pacificus DSM 12653]|uniref:Uncharacterized protein n=1 Tax=Caldanaerobacter subterraneus subsp. pacificus DSM 12653 TaxID=391606 RepID=A0A0F5PIB8_9THEO|nr:hypothetical protein CDSM653_02588 [Caldanaerobacter subterraneus subsp. pacificus DSM 12653]
MVKNKTLNLLKVTENEEGENVFLNAGPKTALKLKE